jgi:hypothetical protein
VAHTADCLLWYATDLAAGARELSTVDMRVRRDAVAADLVATIGSFATVLARVIDGAAPGARGWHSAGLADASEFAAMACDELLVHTSDAARGLALALRPAGGVGRHQPARSPLSRSWRPRTAESPFMGAAAARW